MRILLISDDITLTGGAERVVTNLANAFSELGHEVEILSIHHANTTLPFPLSPSIKIHFTYNHSNKSKFLFKCMIFYYKLKFLISTHTIQKTQKILRLIPNIQSNKGLYDIIMDNTWDSYHPFYKNKHTLYIKLLHVSIEFCGIINNPRYAGKPENFDTFIILSTKELETWQNYHKNIRVIPNFLPEIPTKNTDHKQKVVLIVGRMEKTNQKGFLRLIDIWQLLAKDKGFESEFKQWKLVIVGDGVLKSEIEAKIKALNLQDSIILKPFTKEIEKEYLSASIYAMSSHWEGFPMVLAESASCALASIAFDVKTGPSDIIENEKSGFLIADGDLQGFANKLKLLMSDENLRHKFGENAKKIVSEKFSKEAVLGLWLVLFDEIK